MQWMQDDILKHQPFTNICRIIRKRTSEVNGTINYQLLKILTNVQQFHIWASEVPLNNFSLPFHSYFLLLPSNPSSLFPCHPLRTTYAHTHKDQTICREMHPHRHLYLETHMVRFRRPISIVHVHVIQKNTPTWRQSEI